jgi:hypothetical protein
MQIKEILQRSNQIVFEFFGLDQNIEEMFQNSDGINNSNSDSDDTNESDSDDTDESDSDTDESDSDTDESDSDTDESDSDTDESDSDATDLISENESDDTSDTDVLEVLDNLDNLTLLNTPLQLRRERPEDYLTPLASEEQIIERSRIPNAPRQQRQVLQDIINIRPRKLHFN